MSHGQRPQNRVSRFGTFPNCQNFARSMRLALPLLVFLQMTAAASETNQCFNNSVPGSPNCRQNCNVALNPCLMDVLETSDSTKVDTYTQAAVCSKEYQSYLQSLKAGVDVVVPVGSIVAAYVPAAANLFGKINVPLKADIDYSKAESAYHDMCITKKTETFYRHETWLYEHHLADLAMPSWLACLKLCQPTTLSTSLTTISDTSAQYCMWANPGVRARLTSLFVVGGNCLSSKQEACFSDKAERCLSVPPEEQESCILRRQLSCRKKAGKRPFSAVKDVQQCLHCTRDEATTTLGVSVDTSVGGTLEQWPGYTPTPTVTPLPTVTPTPGDCSIPQPEYAIGHAYGSGHEQIQQTEAVTYTENVPASRICVTIVRSAPQSFLRWVNFTPAGGGAAQEPYDVYFSPPLHGRVDSCECNTYSGGNLGCGQGREYCTVYGWYLP